MIPDPMAGSPLLLRGGFDVFEGLMDGPFQAALLGEAVACRSAATPNEVAVDDLEEVRGGSPARRFLSAEGGPLQDAFYQAGWFREQLAEWVGMPVEPTGFRGTFTYYARPGDYLSLHRDIEACDVAVISCLSDGPEAGDGGSLLLYPGRTAEPLSAIRSSPEKGALRLRLLPGQTIVLLGGIVPHAVLPVGEQQARIVSVLCYRALPPES